MSARDCGWWKRGRWRAIKARFTRRLARRGLSLPRNEDGEYRLWQRRYWEHTIRDEEDLRHHLDYFHYSLARIPGFRYAASGLHGLRYMGFAWGLSVTGGE